MRAAQRILFLLIFVSYSLTGCQTHHFLRRNTNRQLATVTDLINVQVLSNIAMFSSYPNSLPFYSTIDSSTTQVTDGGQITPTQALGGGKPNGFALSLNANRSLAENWKALPMLQYSRLERMRCAFQILRNGMDTGYSRYNLPDGKYQYVFFRESSCINCVANMMKMGLLPTPEKVDKQTIIYRGKEVDGIVLIDSNTTEGELATSYADAYQRDLIHNLNCYLPRCWYSVGRLCEVPFDAVYVGHYRDTYAWVCPDGIDGLTRFSMTIMHIAQNDPDPNAKVTVTKTIFGPNFQIEVTGTENGTISDYRPAGKDLVIQNLLENMGIQQKQLAQDMDPEAKKIIEGKISQYSKAIQKAINAPNLSSLKHELNLDNAIGADVKTEINNVIDKETVKEIRPLKPSDFSTPQPPRRTMPGIEFSVP